MQPQAAADLTAHATAAYPDECCGALIGCSGPGWRVVTDVLALVNTAGEASHRFSVGAEEYRQAEAHARNSGLLLLGFYHSHPDAPAQPSHDDLSQAWPNFDYIIVSVRTGIPADITCWRLLEDRSAFDSEEMTWPTAS
ncbi:MAG: M67 family metallopeptidase [Vicinamibacterales bacterium]